MSTTAVMYPIVAALKKAEDILGPNRRWNATNDMQRRFLAEFFDICRDEVDRIPEIESNASYSYIVINTFLKNHGFTIQLKPWTPPDFGVASVLDILVEWIEKGEVTVVRTDGRQEFPGVRINEQSVQFFSAPGHPNPIAQVETKSGDQVYMTMLDRVANNFDLVAHAQEFSNRKREIAEFGGLIFPMVQLNQEVDIKWLLNMNTRGDDGSPAIILQALQQTKFRMNEVGARAESAVAIAVTKGVVMPRPDHIINRPFLIWFEREGLSRPLFVGHITQEDWRNPGGLNN